MIDLDSTKEVKQLWNNDLDEKDLNQILEDSFFRSLNKINRARFIEIGRAHV